MFLNNVTGFSKFRKYLFLQCCTSVPIADSLFNEGVGRSAFTWTKIYLARWKAQTFGCRGRSGICMFSFEIFFISRKNNKKNININIDLLN